MSGDFKSGEAADRDARVRRGNPIRRASETLSNHRRVSSLRE